MNNKGKWISGLDAVGGSRSLKAYGLFVKILIEFGGSQFEKKDLLGVTGAPTLRAIQQSIDDLTLCGALTCQNDTYQLKPEKKLTISEQKKCENDISTCQNDTLDGEKKIDTYLLINYIINRSSKKVSEPKQGKFASDISEVFDYWSKVMPVTKRTKLDPSRKRKIRARLREGYTVGDLKNAIDGCKSSDWHMENKHFNIGLIFRNSEKTDMFIARKGASPPNANQDPPDYWPPTHGAPKERKNKFIWNQYIDAGLERDAWVARYPDRKSWDEAHK